MNALITGASGTVGQALAAHLRASGHAVTAWDRDVAPPDDYAAMERYVRAVAPDVLFHLAIASTPTGRADEGELVNVTWPSELAWLTRQFGIRFVFTSTVMVFSDDARGPFSVAAAPDAAEGYGAQKRRAEERVWTQNPEARIVRLGWQIGDGTGGNEMTTWADAQQAAHGCVEASTRWLPACAFVEDTAAALAQVAEHRPGVYHADSNDGWTFFDIVSTLATRTGRGWDVVPTHAFAYDQRMPDERLGMPRLSDRLPGL